MTASLQKIADELLKLSVDQRSELADVLYRSVEQLPKAEVDRLWEEEINKRLDDYQAGRSVPIPAEEVHAMIKRTLDEARRVSSGS